ncbi:hypothetical protein C6988_09545 [Nitrosopumilus sp. b1]|uniref:hypothetical protein n=1 Tax=Nitrosopumilus sp. b1 TaxID=2109907 RepID=UPI0015F5AFF0|nr:hypothetical protein [Nitrosopumilus sp. b1]KAF6242221.1 hypothetical protein C6988_09545 [Nitrosopumilus sp. b1]
MKKILIVLKNSDYLDFLAAAQECGKLTAKDMIEDLIRYYVIVQRNKEKILGSVQQRLDGRTD